MAAVERGRMAAGTQPGPSDLTEKERGTRFPVCACVYGDAREVTLRELTGSYGAVGFVGLSAGSAAFNTRQPFVSLSFSSSIKFFYLIPSIFSKDLVHIALYLIVSKLIFSIISEKYNKIHVYIINLQAI